MQLSHILKYLTLIYRLSSDATSQIHNQQTHAKSVLFTKMLQIANEGDSLNEVFKQELNKRLNLKVSQQSTKTETTEMAPGQNDEFVGKNIKIHIVEDRGLSVNTDIVEITSISRVTSMSSLQ